MADNGVQKYSEYDHHDPDITLENVHESWDTLRSPVPHRAQRRLRRHVGGDRLPRGQRDLPQAGDLLFHAR